MTSYVLLPAPPADVADTATLHLVGGLETDGGAHPHTAARIDVPLAPARRPACLLLLAVFSGEAEVRVGGAAAGLGGAAAGLGGAVRVVQAGGLLCAEAGEGALSLHVRGATAFSGAWALLGGALPLCWAARGAALPDVPHGAVQAMLRALWRTVELGGADDGFWGSAQAYGLLMKLRQQEARGAARAPRLVEEAAALIRADFAYLGGVEDLADRLGVSKSHLIRSFSAHMGVPPGKYLTQMRMEHAKLLLQSGGYPLDTVAGMVGVSGANYFCKLFKAHTGMTPAAYACAASREHPARAAAPDPRFYL